MDIAPGEWERVSRALNSRGLKLTGPRRKVLKKLFSASRHLSADDLYDALRREGTPVSKATVYRTLAVFEECGFFESHDFGHGRKVYEKTEGRRHHDHLVCVGCGKLIEFQEPRIEKLQAQVARKHGFRLLHHSHQIFGYCPQCPGGRKGGR